jgi:hypothetical protein
MNDVEEAVDIVDVHIGGKSLPCPRLHAMDGRVFVSRSDVYEKMVKGCGISEHRFKDAMLKVTTYSC